MKETIMAACPRIAASPTVSMALSPLTIQRTMVKKEKTAARGYMMSAEARLPTT